MVITCPNCNIQYNIDSSRLKTDGSKLRCAKYRNVFAVFPENTADSIELDGLLDNFYKELNKVIESISKIQSVWEPEQNASKDNTEPEGITDTDNIRLAFDELEKLLIHNDLQAEDCFESLKARIRGSDVQDQMNKLEEQISSLDFEGAVQRLRELANIMNISFSGDLNE